MDAPAAAYRRLPGKTPWFRFGSVSAPTTSLWLGPDHLLKIERSASRESYKRFFYRDIQAIFIEESSRRYFLSIFALAAVAIVFLLTLSLSRSAISGLPTALLISSPFAAGIVINLALGRTSQAVLVTAVGTEPLSSFSRLQRSIAAMERIRAEVAKAQGDVATAQLVTHWPAQVATPQRD